MATDAEWGKVSSLWSSAHLIGYKADTLRRSVSLQSASLVKCWQSSSWMSRDRLIALSASVDVMWSLLKFDWVIDLIKWVHRFIPITDLFPSPLVIVFKNPLTFYAGVIPTVTGEICRPAEIQRVDRKSPIKSLKIMSSNSRISESYQEVTETQIAANYLINILLF